MCVSNVFKWKGEKEKWKKNRLKYFGEVETCQQDCGGENHLGSAAERDNRERERDAWHCRDKEKLTNVVEQHTYDFIVVLVVT